jgi:hypothetical protein
MASNGIASAITGWPGKGIGSATGIAGLSGGGGGGGAGGFAAGVGATLLRSEVQRSQNSAPSSFSK